MDELAPVHPGEVLVEELIAPLGVTQHKVAIAIGLPLSINEIVHGKRRISADPGAAARPLLRYDRPVPDQPAEPLRPEIERDNLGPELDSIEHLQPA